MSWKQEKTLVENALQVQFYGPAVDAHQMDVHDLAESLLGIESAYRQVYAALFGPERPAPRLGLSSVEEGSFIYDVTIMQDFAGMWDFAKSILNSEDAQAITSARDATEILILVGGSIWGVVGKVKSHQKRQAVQQARDAIKEAEEQDSESQQAELLEKMDEILSKLSENRPDFDPDQARDKLAALPTTKAFVDATKKTLSPLGKAGYDSISLSGPRGSDKEVVIRRDDYEHLDLAIDDDQFQTEVLVTTANLKFDQVKFSPGTRTYSFTSNGLPLRARILDEVFRERLSSGIQRIGANDTIRVRLRTTIEHLPAGSQSSHEVLEVLEVNAYTPPDDEDELPIS